MVSAIRDLRNKNQLKPKEELQLLVRKSDKTVQLLSTSGSKTLIQRLSFLSEVKLTESEDQGHAFLLGTEQFFLMFEKSIDVEAEKSKFKMKLIALQAF